MPSPNRPKAGRPHRKRDEQKWFFDWMIKETGKVFHFQPDGRGRFPRSVRSHDTISKHMGLSARRLERLAQAEAGHRETAMEIYFQATLQYHDAQHVVFETNDEKRFLHGGLMRCYGKVRDFAPYRIEPDESAAGSNRGRESGRAGNREIGKPGGREVGRLGVEGSADRKLFSPSPALTHCRSPGLRGARCLPAPVRAASAPSPPSG